MSKDSPQRSPSKVENLSFQIVLINVHLLKSSIEEGGELKISINRGKQVFDETKNIPIQMKQGFIVDLHRARLNFMIFSFDSSKGYQFSLKINQIVQGEQRCIGEFLINCNLYAQNFFKSGNGAFQETLFLSEAEKINVELYVEKNRYALEKLVRQMTNFREKSQVLVEFRMFQRVNSKYQLNLSPKRQRQNHFKRNSPTKISFKSQSPSQSAKTIDPDPEIKISKSSYSNGAGKQKTNPEETVNKSSNDNGKQKISEAQKAKELKKQETLEEPLHIVHKQQPQKQEMTMQSQAVVVSPVQQSTVMPQVTKMQEVGPASQRFKIEQTEEILKTQRSDNINFQTAAQVQNATNNANQGTVLPKEIVITKKSLVFKEMSFKLKVFLTILLIVFLLASNHFEEKEEKQPFNQHSQERNHTTSSQLNPKQSLKAKKPKKHKKK